MSSFFIFLMPLFLNRTLNLALEDDQFEILLLPFRVIRIYIKNNIHLIYILKYSLLTDF